MENLPSEARCFQGLSIRQHHPHGITMYHPSAQQAETLPLRSLRPGPVQCKTQSSDMSDVSSRLRALGLEPLVFFLQVQHHALWRDTPSQ